MSAEDVGPPVQWSDTDSEGNSVTWIATDALGSLEAHRRMLELLFSPVAGG
jgi:hypothetical protein